MLYAALQWFQRRRPIRPRLSCSRWNCGENSPYPVAALTPLHQPRVQLLPIFELWGENSDALVCKKLFETGGWNALRLSQQAKGNNGLKELARFSQEELNGEGV